MENLNNNENETQRPQMTTEEYTKALHMLQEMEFKLRGGWTGLATDIILFSLKWTAIGFSVGIGWNLVRWLGLFTV